jgi:HAD superfamily hydrolase (TIGR01509 family)
VSGKPRLQAVVFDNDGLLLDTEESWTRAQHALFDRHGLTFTDQHKRDMLGSSPQAAAQSLARIFDKPGDGPALVLELAMLALQELERHAPPRPGAVELLARLQAAAIPIGLASNSPRMLVDRALATAAIAPEIFTVILTADAIAHPKPAPDIYLAACRALGPPPELTLVLEDSPTGIEAAVAAGCHTIAVPSVPGMDLSAAVQVVDSLASPAITAALGL